MHSRSTLFTDRKERLVRASSSQVQDLMAHQTSCDGTRGESPRFPMESEDDDVSVIDPSDGDVDNTIILDDDE